VLENHFDPLTAFPLSRILAYRKVLPARCLVNVGLLG